MLEANYFTFFQRGIGFFCQLVLDRYNESFLRLGTVCRTPRFRAIECVFSDNYLAPCYPLPLCFTLVFSYFFSAC